MKLVGDRYVDENGPDDAQPGPAEVVAEGVEHPPAKVNRWLAVALAAAVLVAGALGGWLYLDHRQTADERAVVALVAANNSAWDAGDGTAVLATMTREGFWVPGALQSGEVGDRLSGPRLAEFVRSMKSDRQFTLEAVGRTEVVGGNGAWTATVPCRISFTGDGGGTFDGVSVFAVVERGGKKLIAAELYLPTDL